MQFDSSPAPFTNLIPITSSLFGNLDLLSTNTRLVSSFEIVYQVTQSSEYGDLVLADNSEHTIKSFTQRDLDQNRLAFKQKRNVVRQTVFNIMVRVVNTLTRQEQTVEIKFSSNPENVFAPDVELRNPLTVDEGTSVLLTSEYLTARHSIYNSQNLVCEIKWGSSMRGGRFEVSGFRRTQFRISELISGNVRYLHNGDDEYWDNVILTVKAGENETRILMRILVNPIDDRTPEAAKDIQLNKYLTLVGSNWKTVSPRDLFSIDADSSIEHLMYAFKVSSQNNVTFRRLDLYHIGKYEADISNWTQIEIIRGQIQCRNLLSSFNTTTEYVKLDVLDNANFPHTHRHLLAVKMIHLDEEAPTPSNWARMYAEIEDYQPTVISKKELEYVDTGTLTPSEIIYKITTRPYDRNPDNPLKVGKICLSPAGSAFENPSDCNTQQFTQEDVNNRQLFYLPPIKERGVVTRFVEFIFSVTDSVGNTRFNQYFNLNLKPIADSPPRVFVKNFRVQPNSYHTLSNNDFVVIDPESPSPSDLTFTIRKFPIYVTVLRDGIRMSSTGISIFTQKDLLDNKISLKVGDAVDVTDSFETILSDGVNLVPLKVHISIDSFNEYTVDSQINENDITVGIYVRQNSAVTLTMVSVQCFR